MEKKVLFIDNAHPVFKEELTKLGFICEVLPDSTKEEVESIIENYYGIIIRSRIQLDKDILSKAKKLKFIGRVGSGLESIDLEYAGQKGIKCLNSPEGNRDAVGEHSIGLLLNLMNNISKADKDIRNGKWEREANRGIEIKGKTIGIIGYGNMGSSFARKLKGFEANVIAYDKYKKDYSDEFVKESSLENLFKECNILSLHVPLTAETTYMVNDSFINRFKNNIIIINTSRGKVLNTDDLVKNLRTGKVIAAGLDVIEYEELSFEKMDFTKLPDTFKYLNNSDKVIMTPHIAGWTVESKYKLSMVLVDKIKELMKNKAI